MNKTKEKKKVHNEEGVYRSRKLPNWLYWYCNMYMNTSVVDKLVMTMWIAPHPQFDIMYSLVCQVVVVRRIGGKINCMVFARIIIA